ncbi:cilia- and flagella-associated protein 70-like [Coregonus clupeaformis]|uniref:cilia- and flagella-associated protein 70-like n=1 Tax=Coregonus clupeaformis TaxID=59861 RepID=UPI001E1C6B14|nr:cilia- and flagella-associated protein 70-like [Coregonus clupeaformis]
MEQFRGAGDKAVPVKITVLRGNNLRGNKAESILIYVRAEFNGIILGDSQKLDAAVDQGVDYNFTCSFECSDAGHTLDDMAHKPVILTVIEFLPKEKKQKEEKTAVIGQAIVDLLPILHGQVSFSSTVLLHPTPGSPADAASQEGSCKPSLDVTVCVPEPLLSGVQLSESNLLKVTVETAYSVPEVWNPVSGSGPPCSYVAALQVPLTAEKEQVLLFSNGLLKVDGEGEPMGRPRKWPLGPLLASGAQFIPGVSMEGEPIEMEDGDLTSIEDRDFRNEAETNKKRVSWDTERRCFLDADGAACLTRRIAESRLWPVEVMRSPQVGATKGGKAGKDKGGEDETQLSFHAVAYVDMAPLLYPGARRIRGAYRLYPFYGSDLLVKPGTQGKSAPIGTDSVTLVEPEQQQQVNTEGQMYADSRTYIIIEIAFEKSLVPKRSPEELAKRVMELIPPRAPLPRRPAGAERAVQEYQAQIASVAGQVLEQYQQLFGPAFLPGEKPLDPTSQEQRKTKLLGELNYSGKYFAFKEQIKYSVVRIVRDKPKPNPNVVSGCPGDSASPPGGLCPAIHFAKEAQLNGDYQLAAQYYQEQLTRDRSDPAHWFDYGVFYMLTADYQKAEECFHYAVSMEQTHLPSLLMCGILAEMGGRLEEAETFFEGATCVDPTNVVAWTLFGELHPDRDGLPEASVVTGSQSCQGSKPGEGYKGGAEAEPSTMRHLATPTRLNTTIYMETVQFLLQNNALQMAQRALAQELLCPEGGLSSSYHLVLARLQLLRAEYGSAESSLKEAVNDSFQDPDVWALFGHIHHLTGEFGKAQKCYERTLDFVTDATDTHPIYLRLGSIYLQEEEFQRAKTTYLRACKSTPSCLTWLGLGIACYRLGELTEAEDALTEANTLNNGNAEVWGYLSLVSLQMGRRLEAEQSYKYALKLNLQKEAVLCEIKALQDHVGFGNPCF